MPTREGTSQREQNNPTSGAELLSDGSIVLHGDGIVDAPWGVVVEMNARWEFEFFVRSLPESDRDRVKELENRAATALMEGLEQPMAAKCAIERTLARLCNQPAGDLRQQGAREMIVAGFCALWGDEDAGQVAAQFAALLQGAKDVDSNTIKVRAIATAVGYCLACRTHSNAEFASVMVGDLLRRLALVDARVRERLDERKLGELLDEYSSAKSVRRKSLEGVVADILRHGRLLGRTEASPRQVVVQYVAEALKPKGPFKPKT